MEKIKCKEETILTLDKFYDYVDKTLGFDGKTVILNIDGEELIIY